MLTSEPSRAEVAAMGAVLPAIDIAAVILRLYGKRVRGASYGVDDWLIIFSLVIACGGGAVLLTGVATAGFGIQSPHPTSNSGIDEADTLLLNTKRLAVVMNWIQMWTLGASKLSVLFFYRSIFVTSRFKALSLGMIVIVLTWTFGGFFAVAFQCRSHIELLWSSAASTAQYCTSGKDVALGFAIPDAIIDLVIICMPVYWTTALQMSQRKRLATIGVFCFGAITVLASFVRLGFYAALYPTIKQNPNQLGVQTNEVYWSMFEIGLSIIAACLPTFWPLLARSPTNRLGYTLRTLVRHPRRSTGQSRSPQPERGISKTVTDGNQQKDEVARQLSMERKASNSIKPGLSGTSRRVEAAEDVLEPRPKASSFL